MNLTKKQQISIAIAAMLAIAALAPLALADSILEIDIPYEKFILKNGLTLIVHEDHKAPIVALNIWYHVGSKNEKLGKTGFAHLFEHLMFNGSEHVDEDFFMPLEKLGATNMNGTTSQDRTNYFETVPKSALDTVLWLESDRMGHLIAAITQEKLDVQRGVVQNEKRQGENRPYGKVFETLTQNTWPAGHPYSWEVIGSMEDLNAASLDDVHGWFRDYYGTSNAVLVVAGDVEAADVKTRVEKYFGAIPSGPPVTRPVAWTAKRTGKKRIIMQDRVPQERLLKSWNVPRWGTADADYLDLAAGVLSWGKSSRLEKRLVNDEQIATQVSAYSHAQEIAGQFLISAMVRPGVDLEQVEKAIDEELERFLKEGPTEKELKRIKAIFYASFVRGIEEIGGFGGKSDVLAECETFGGSPDIYKESVARLNAATVANVLDTARAWLSDGEFALEVHPFPPFETAEQDADRSKMPEAGEAPDAVFPEIKQATLSNGVKIYLAERHAVPVISFDLIVGGGAAADPKESPGVAQLTMKMLTEGTKNRTLLEISDESDMLGANIGASAGLDNCSVSLSALKVNLEDSLDLWGDIVLNPSFTKEDFERLRKRHLAGIKSAKSNPNAIAAILAPAILYGKTHPYGHPASGTEESASQISTDDLTAYHKAWFKPNNATLIVAGDTTLEEIQPRLEKLFAAWEKGDVDLPKVEPAALATESTVYIVDQPGAPQAVVTASHVAPAKTADNSEVTRMMNYILGGAFTSRINMNLREEKHWTYGARSDLQGGKVQRRFTVSTGVQIDKAADSMSEIAKELDGIMGDKPITTEEFEKSREFRALSLTGSWETSDAVAGTIVDMVLNGFPLDYAATLSSRVRKLSLEDTREAANQILKPKRITWLIVGDLEKMEKEIRVLNLGPTHVLDVDGNEITPKP